MANQKYILAIDSGTTSVRSIIFDHSGKAISINQKEITQYFPEAGWVEHDALEIYNNQLTTIVNAKRAADIKSKDIIAAGITNQRETIVVWSKITGNPVYNALVWQDQRTAEWCEKISKDKKISETIRKKTGLIINPYFSASKLKWLLENVPGIQERIKTGEILAGTIDTWLVWKLTGGKVHATDVSNASRTLLFNINTMKWDDELLKIFNIPKSILPEVKSSCDDFGTILPEVFSKKATGIVPIAGVGGDQQCALFGQLCTKPGQIKTTFGTGCFTLLNIGEKPILSKHRLLTTVAWKLGKEKPVYALEGSVFIGGAAIKWLKDSVKIMYDDTEADFYSALALTRENGQRVYVVPAFTGLGAPYWDTSARGAIFGLERGTKREHIVRATIESIAYQTNDLITAMKSDFGKPIHLMKVDGGVCRTSYLMQFQANISELEVQKPVFIETTAIGAAYLAGLQIKFWKSISELQKIAKIDKTYKPQFDKKSVSVLKQGWESAIKRTRGWLDDIK